MAEAGGGPQGMAVAARVSMNSHGGGGGAGATVEAGTPKIFEGSSDNASGSGLDSLTQFQATVLPQLKSLFGDGGADQSITDMFSRLSAYTGNIGSSALSGELVTAPNINIDKAASSIGGVLGTKASVFGTAK